MARPAEGAGSPLHPDTSFESAPEVVQISTKSLDISAFKQSVLGYKK